MFSRIQPSVNGQNPRKRQKRSHEPEADQDTTSNFAMSSNAASRNCNSAAADEKFCHHEQTLRRLEPDLEAMRQLITCKMCYCFLTEPYSLACGHTYCYICLDSWLVAQRKSTCPDCRAVVKQQPTPSYTVREMTMIFTSRAELLPKGETLEDHEKYATEAAAKVARDKANGQGDDNGLFSGKFSWRHRMHFMPMHDATDGVDRCPICNWEVEDGVCSGCGETMGDDAGLDMSDMESESSDDDDDLDHEIDAVDAEIDVGYDSEGTEVPHIDEDIFGAFPPVRPPVLGANSRRSRRQIALDESDEDSSEDEDEHDPQMDSFIDDEADESGSESGDSEDEEEEEEAQSTPHSRLHRRAPVLIDSDDDLPAATNHNPIYINSDDESEVGAPVARNNPSHRQHRHHHHLILSDDEDESSSDGINDDEPEDEDNADLGTAPSFASSDDAGAIEAAGFSPVSVDSDGFHPDELHEQYHDIDDQNEDDRQTSVTPSYSSETPGFYAFNEATDDEDDVNEHESDDISPTTPPSPRPAESRHTHRLSTNQRRRPRSQPRLVPLPEPRGGRTVPSASTMTASGVLQTARHTAQQNVNNGGLPHPFQLDDTLARVNAQQQRVRQGGSSRGVSGLRRCA